MVQNVSKLSHFEDLWKLTWKFGRCRLRYNFEFSSDFIWKMILFDDFHPLCFVKWVWTHCWVFSSLWTIVHWTSIVKVFIFIYEALLSKHYHLAKVRFQWNWLLVKWNFNFTFSKIYDYLAPKTGLFVIIKTW